MHVIETREKNDGKLSKDWFTDNFHNIALSNNVMNKNMKRLLLSGYRQSS